MNQYQRSKQISPSQVARNLDKIKADHIRRPLHPDRLAVENQVLEAHRPELGKLWGRDYRARVAELEQEINAILFPKQEQS